jgi:DHA1 family tetracycline resistance protein-like MFS transporter
MAAEIIEQRRKAAVRYILVTILLEVLALGLTIPALPKLVEQFMGGDTARAVAAFGAMAMLWALMQLFFSPILGALSDRFGRRPVILLSHAGVGLDYVLMAFAPSLFWLFLGRAVAGLSAATFSTSAAYIADVTPAERRAAEVGKIGAVFGVGFIIAPAIGGMLATIDLRLPFFAASALALASAAYGYFILPESLAKSLRRPFRLAAANPVSALAIYRSAEGLMPLGVVAGLHHLAHALWPSVGVLYLSHRYGWGPYEVGLVLALLGLSGALMQGVLIGPIVRRIGPLRALLVGLTAGAIAFAIQGLAATPVVYFLSVPFVAFWGLTGPSVFQLSSARVDADRQGALQGADATLIGLGNLAGPLMFSQSLAWAIAPSSALPIPGLPLFIAAAVMMAAVMVVLATIKTTRGAERAH